MVSFVIIKEQFVNTNTFVLKVRLASHVALDTWHAL